MGGKCSVRVSSKSYDFILEQFSWQIVQHVQWFLGEALSVFSSTPVPSLWCKGRPVAAWDCPDGHFFEPFFWLLFWRLQKMGNLKNLNNQTYLACRILYHFYLNRFEKVLFFFWACLDLKISEVCSSHGDRDCRQILQGPTSWCRLNGKVQKMITNWSSFVCFFFLFVSRFKYAQHVKKSQSSEICLSFKKQQARRRFSELLHTPECRKKNMILMRKDRKACLEKPAFS